MKNPTSRLALLFVLGVALTFWSLTPGSLTPEEDASRETFAMRALNPVSPGMFDIGPADRDAPRSGFLELVVHVPFILAARTVSSLPETQAVILAIEPVLLSTLIVLLVFLWSQRLTGDRLRAIGYALIAGFCTMIWPYAYIAMEVQQSLFLLLAAFMALGGTSRRTWIWWLLFGVCCGMAISVKLTSIALVPAVAFLMNRSYAEDQTGGRLARLSASMSVAALMFLANTLWRNREGTLIEDCLRFFREHAVADPLEWAFNVVALISAPGKGLIIFVPVAVVSAILFRRAWEQQRDLAIFTLLTFAPLAAALAAVDVWSDETWGPRHLHVLSAPLVLLIAAAKRRGDRVMRAALLVAAFLGFCVSFLGSFYHYGIQQRVAEASGQSTLQTLQMNPKWNHVKFNARLLGVWITASDGSEVYWNPGPRWYYDIPVWASELEAVRIDPFSRPQPLLIEHWEAKVPSAAWLSVFLSLLAGPALILLSIGAARDGGTFFGRGPRYAGLAWIVCVTLIYAAVCLDTLYSPFGPGDEKAWAIPLAVVSTIVIAGHFLARNLFLRIMFPLLVALSVAIIIFQSGSVGAFLVAALLLISAFGFGMGLMRLMRLSDDRFGTLEATLCAIMAGFGILGVGGYSLAVLHLLDAPFVAALLGAGLILSLHSLRRLNWRSVIAERESVREAPALLAMGGYMLLLNLVWAVAPEVQFDALNYHMHVAAAWARAGGAVDLLYTHSYLAGLMETVYSLSLVLSTQTAAKMVPFMIGLVNAGCVYVLTARIAGRRAASWAALLFYSVPLIYWSSSTTDVELALAAFIATLALSLVRWHESGNANWFYFAAVLFGAGIAVKPTMVLVAPALAAILFLYLRSERGLRGFRTIAFMVLIALAMSVPWYALRMHHTGNPIYPVLNQWFPVHRYVDPVGPPLGGGMRVPLAAASLVRFPVVFTFDTVDYSESGVTSGGVGPYLLLALPAVFLLRRPGNDFKLLFTFAVTYAVLWILMFSYARFIVPILPLLVAIAVACVMAVTEKRLWLARTMFILIFAGQALSMPVQFWSVPDRIPIRHAVGLETGHEFRSRTQRAYPALAYLNQHAEPGDTAIGVGFERVRYYLEIPYHSWRDLPEVRTISHLADEKQVAMELSSRSYDWLIIDELEPHNSETYLRPEFLDCFAELRFRSRDHAVYSLRSMDEACR